LKRIAGWERDLTRYLIVAIIFGIVVTLPFFIGIPAEEFDLIIDGSMQLIRTVISSSVFALTFYYIEEHFGSASLTDSS
jgi:hypothetical protein